MSLSKLIRIGVNGSVATATSATHATKPRRPMQTVATVATVAVAEAKEDTLVNLYQGGASQHENSDVHIDLQRFVDETIDKIDLAGRPWDEFNGSLSVSERQQLKEVGAKVDAAVVAKDRNEAVIALAEYKELVLGLRHRSK